MIFLLDPENAADYPHLLDDLFDGRERWLRHLEICPRDSSRMREDELDFAHPNYLVCLSASGALLGSARILHSTGPNTASLYLDGPSFANLPLLRSPTIWEVSRVCLSPDLPDEDAPVSKIRVLAELTVAAVEMAQKSGISSYLAILDRECERLLDLGRIHDREILERGTTSCGLEVSVGVTNCDEICVPRLKERAGIEPVVWLDTADIFAMEARVSSGGDADISQAFEVGIRGDLEVGPRGSLSESQRLRLLDYCSHQIISAASDADRDSAIRLAEELLRKLSPPPGSAED